MTRTALFVAAAALIGGCGRSQYPLSGAVTYGGKPVPFGQMMIVPDETKGNAAPGVMLDFKDGRYQTPGTRGQYGGAYKVVISGFDGIPPKKQNPADEIDRRGSPLFSEYTVSVDLPVRTATYDFDVPTQPADKKR